MHNGTPPRLTPLRKTRTNYTVVPPPGLHPYVKHIQTTHSDPLIGWLGWLAELPGWAGWLGWLAACALWQDGLAGWVGWLARKNAYK